MRQCGSGSGEGQPPDPEGSIALYWESAQASNQPPRDQGYQAYMLLRVQRRSVKVFQSIMHRQIPFRSRSAVGSLTPLRYPWKNLGMSQAVSRFPMSYTARASVWAQPGNAVPGPCFFSKRARYFWPAGLCRRKRTAASEKAHLRELWPMLAPEVPERFPADSLAHLTKRQ